MPDIQPIARYLTREEALVYYNRRGMRIGIIGDVLDAAEGKQVDKVAAMYGLKREPAVLWGYTMPWSQSDEVLRSRTFLAFQDKHYDPNDKRLHIYP